MTNQSTIDKLIEMRLTAMADAFRIQMDDPAMKEVPFEDRFGMLIDVCNSGYSAGSSSYGTAGRRPFCDK